MVREFCVFHSHFLKSPSLGTVFCILHPPLTCLLSWKPTTVGYNQGILISGFDCVWPVGGNGKTAEDWGRKRGKRDFPDASLLSSWLCVPGSGGILGSPLLLGGLSSWTPEPIGLPHRVPSPCLLPWRSAKRTSSCCQSLRTSHLSSVPSTRTHLWNQSIH